MKTEFNALTLDSIRYSLVWEDSETLFHALNINENDEVLIITSAGCNVLNALLKNPKSVTAIDLNPNQNRLLKLKQHLILHHEFETYMALCGFKNEESVGTAVEKLMSTLIGDEKLFWKEYFKINDKGLLKAGRLESYIGSFLKTLTQPIQDNLEQLLNFNCINKQTDFFQKNLDKSDFKDSFISYFDDNNLSKGRDTKLLKYAEESGGIAFYNRLVNQIENTLIKENFYFRFFFFGPEKIPEHILPICYQQKNYQLLRQNIHKLNIVNNEAVEFLSSKMGKNFTKASLSNIFEYISHNEFQLVCDTLAKNIKHSLKIVFWNLLNSQADERLIKPKSLKVKEQEVQSSSCFYFKNVISLSFNPLKS